MPVTHLECSRCQKRYPAGEILHTCTEDGAPLFARYDLERTVKTLVARSCTEVAPEGLRQKVMLSIQQVQVRLTSED